MRIDFIAKNYTINDRLKEVVEKKLGKFDNYFDADAEARIVCREVNTDKYTMELTINFGGGKVLRSEVTSDNMFSNIDIIMPKIERQVRRFKTIEGKKIKFKPEYELEGDIEYKLPQVVKNKKFTLKEISVDEAIQALEMSEHSFYVFINRANNFVNVIYKRKDGNIGLIDLVY